MSEQPERVPVRGRLFREPEYVAVRFEQHGDRARLPSNVPHSGGGGISSVEVPLVKQYVDHIDPWSYTAPWLSREEWEMILRVLEGVTGHIDATRYRVEDAIALLQSRLYPTSNNKEAHR